MLKSVWVSLRFSLAQNNSGGRQSLLPQSRIRGGKTPLRRIAANRQTHILPANSKKPEAKKFTIVGVTVSPAAVKGLGSITNAHTP